MSFVTRDIAMSITKTHLQRGTSVSVDFIRVSMIAEQQSTDIWSVMYDSCVKRRQCVAGCQ